MLTDAEDAWGPCAVLSMAWAGGETPVMSSSVGAEDGRATRAGEEIPIIRGSALHALNGTEPKIGKVRDPGPAWPMHEHHTPPILLPFSCHLTRPHPPHREASAAPC